MEKVVDTKKLAPEHCFNLNNSVWLTVKCAAFYLGTSTKFIRAIMVDGLSYYKVRNTIFIKKDDLDKYIEKHKIV